MTQIEKIKRIIEEMRLLDLQRQEARAARKEMGHMDHQYWEWDINQAEHYWLKLFWEAASPIFKDIPYQYQFDFYPK